MTQYDFPNGLCDELITATKSQIDKTADINELVSLRKTLSILQKIKPHADNKDFTECGKIMRDNIDEREDLQRRLNDCFDRDRLLMRITGFPLVSKY